MMFLLMSHRLITQTAQTLRVRGSYEYFRNIVPVISHSIVDIGRTGEVDVALIIFNCWFSLFFTIIDRYTRMYCIIC